MSLLEVREATLRFGGVAALEGVSFEVEQGEVFAIVGPNGAGKSTLFNLISRLHEPSEGDIRFEGRSLLDRPASGIAGLDIARSSSPCTLCNASSIRLRSGWSAGATRSHVRYAAAAACSGPWPFASRASTSAPAAISAFVTVASPDAAATRSGVWA